MKMKLSNSVLLSLLNFLMFITFVYAQEEAKILYFQIVRSNNGHFVRRLKQNDILRFSFGFTFLAHTVGKVHNITYTSPIEYTTDQFPYAFNGIYKLPQGEYKIAAYINNDLSTNFQITASVRYPKYPLYGPSPFKMKPLNDSSKIYPIPSVDKSGCKRTLSPAFSDFDISANSICGNLKGAAYTTTVTSCIGENSLRLRRLQLFKENGILKTIVKSTSVHSSYGNPSFIYENENKFQCPKGSIFYEGCQKRTMFSSKCGTSKLQAYNPKIIRDPWLLYRPPIELKLHPGDSAIITLRNRNSTKDADYLTPLSTGEGTGGQNTSYKFQLVVQSRTGAILKRSKAVNNKEVSIKLEKVTRGKFDGAVVYLEYAYSFCPKFKSVNLIQHYGTKIVVDKAVESLKIQDSKLPTFPHPTLKPTAVGDPLSITVYAKNPGGGRRENGKQTELTYQWYRLYYWGQDVGVDSKAYPTPIIGENGSILQIRELENFYFYFGHSSSLLHTYFVDVCNTLGCRRSKGIDIGTLLPDYFLEFSEC